MIILTTTYNCENYVERSLLSIMSQTHKDFTCYVTDDLSTDNTVKKIKEIISEDNRFVLIQNKSKMYQPGNYNQVINSGSVNDDEICIEVDGDDWLPHPKVFSNISKIYEDPNIWMTSGSFIYHDGRKGFASPPTNNSDIRKQVFTLSHLRTWKSWLWKKIDEKDLKDENGLYWSVSGDLAFMFPMFEMSGTEHYRFIEETNYVYNESNPINDHKINMDQVLSITNKIRNKPKYNKL